MTKYKVSITIDTESDREFAEIVLNSEVDKVCSKLSMFDTGLNINYNIHKISTCTACSGSGVYDHNGSPPCSGCAGSGKISTSCRTKRSGK